MTGAHLSDEEYAALRRIRRVIYDFEKLITVYGDDNIGGYTPGECYEHDIETVMKALAARSLPESLKPA